MTAVILSVLLSACVDEDPGAGASPPGEPMEARDSDGDGLSNTLELVLGTDPGEPDSDGDGLSDGDEVSVHGTDPGLPDTDGDGLTDAAEVTEHGTDPGLPDTDGDGLTDDRELEGLTDPLAYDSDLDGLSDGLELALGIDPLEPDSDGDGLLDGVELNIHSSDPTSTDSDGDGLLDGDEVGLHGTDPVSADSDGDGLSDPEELQRGSHPLRIDTDGGGAPDGREVLSDQTDPVDPTDDVCDFPNELLDDPSWVPEGPAFDPTWISMSWGLLSDLSGNHDFWLDVDGDGRPRGEERSSSYLRLNLYGPELDYLCSVLFDADRATPVAQPSWIATGTIYEAFELEPVGGVTDCPALDPLVYGTDDVRALLGGLPWGFGFGELAEVAGPLQRSILADGGDWLGAWEPYLYGGWITWDQTEAFALGYGTVHDAACAQIPIEPGGTTRVLPAVSMAPLPYGLRSTTELFVYDLAYVTGIRCARAQVPAGNPDWVPAPEPMDPVYVGFGVDVVMAPEGGLADFWFDADRDGRAEAYSASVTISVYDASTEPICTLIYEADTATEIDPSTWTAIDITGAPSGPIWRGWSLDLVHGDAIGCGTIDEVVWGTENIQELLSGTPFGFGIGELNDLADQGPSAFADWAAIEGTMFAVYLSFDGQQAVEANFGQLIDVDDCLVVEASQAVHPREIAASGRIGDLLAPPFYLFPL
ncbi:MAG TPA: hypothetical protein ENK18_00115 [Deltaproteobacteria bacterium]|nr:hypothetical protein [Deltaproteobacteria bacterium]